MFLVSCQQAGISGSDIWNKIIWFGSLGFLGATGNPMEGFMRILVITLVFAIFYELGGLLPVTPSIRMTISLILALMSGIFIPATVLAGIGAAYGTLVALFLIGAPVVGGLYAIYRIPNTTRFYIFLRIVIILILLTILISVKIHALDLVNIGPQTIVFP
ncbi:MAG: hypothetical protein Q7K45_04100 [Nanoarchaeota archaeon]|nr:hypothetical protein [Nanoarchaeota archaeon]